MVKVRPFKRLMQGCCVFVTCTGHPQIYTKTDQVDIREINGAHSHQEGCKIMYLWESRNIYSFSRGEPGLLMKHPVMYVEHESFTGHRAHSGFHRIPARSSKPDCWDLSAWPSWESNIHCPAETTPSWRLSCSFGRGFAGMMRTEGYVFFTNGI